MAILHLKTGIIHNIQEDKTTGCGLKTNVSPHHWTQTNNKIDCHKKGCNN